MFVIADKICLLQLSRSVDVGAGVGVVVDLVTLSVEIQTAGWPDLLFTARHSQSWLASRRGDDNNNTTQHQTNSRNEGLTVTLYLPGGCFIKSF